MKKAVVFFILIAVSLCFAVEERMVISIKGMTDGGCVNKVTDALNKIDGVKSAEVSFKPGTAVVIFESGKTNDEALLKAVTKLGYKAVRNNNIISEVSDSKTKSKPVSTKGCPPTCPSLKHCDLSGKVTGTGLYGKPVCVDLVIGKPQKDSHQHEGSDGHVCPTVSCKELIEFHNVMHPMHVAIDANDYAAFRLQYPQMAKKTEEVKQMKCGDSCKGDKKACEKLSARLVESVKKLGKACDGDDNSKLNKIFMEVHDAYVAFGKVCK